MMPTCREVARLLASDQLAEASPVRKILVRLHLLMCGRCHRYAKELKALGETAREAFREPLDPARLAALERAILDQASQGGGAA